MDENKLNLSFWAGVQVGDDVFFSACNMNGLFKYNPQTEQCDFLKGFPGEEDWGVHSEAILYQNTIWFIPLHSERIAIVDLKSLDITYLPLPESGYRPEGRDIAHRRMMGCYKKGEKFLWLVPYTYNLFIKIDMDKRQIMEVQEWATDEFALAVGVRVQNKLWVYANNAGELREINLDSGEQVIRKIWNDGIIYSGIQNVGDRILLFSPHTKDGVSILNYDIHEKAIVHLDDNGQAYREYQALTEEEEVLLVPYFGNKSVRIYMEDDCCFIKEFMELEIKENAYCSAKMIYNDQIWFLSHDTETPIICYDKRSDTFQNWHITIERKKYNEALARNITEYNPLNTARVLQESIISLDNYIYFVEYAGRGENITKEEKIGSNIYKKL